MEQGDPETRIANLEQRPEPLSLDAASRTGSSHRFVARVVPGTIKHTFGTVGLLMAGGAAFWAGEFAAYMVAKSQTLMGAVALVYFVFVVVVVLRRLVFLKKVLVDVTPEGLAIDRRPGDVFPFSGAQLGQWRVREPRGELVGRALYLTSGPDRFVLGEMGTRTRDTHPVPLEGPQTKLDGLNAWMSSQVFEELLTVVAPQRWEQ